MAVGDRGLGQVGVDRGGADADQHREIVRVQAFAAAGDQVAEAAQALADQVAVDRTHGQDHRDRRPLGADRLVAQDQRLAAAAHGFLGLLADALERHAHAALGAGLEGAVDGAVVGAEMGPGRLHLAGGQDRALELEDPGLAGVLVIDVAEIAEAGLQAHHPPFAQRVDRRVGDLAELLAEEVVQPAIVRGQHGQGRVVAHRAHRLLGVEHHGREDQLHVLDGEPVESLTTAQLGALVLRGREGAGLRALVEMGDVLHPAAVGLERRQMVLELQVVVEAARNEVDGDVLARADPALLDDFGVDQRHHSGLGADHQQPVAGARVAHGPQAAAVEPGHHPARIGGDDGGGSVPGLHDAVAVAEQVAMRRRDRHAVGPGRRDQHGLDQRQRAAGADQGLADGVQRGAVGAAGLDDRLDVLVVLAERGCDHPRLVAPHPVDVAAQGVDLAIVRQGAEWLRQPPGRHGVGRVALVEQREARDEPLVLQVGVEGRQGFGEKQTLVDHRAAAERADVEFGDVLGQRLLLDPAPDQIEVALEPLLVEALGVADDDLLDLGARGRRLLAQYRRVDRHLAPAADGVAEAQHLALDQGATGLLLLEAAAWQEHHADRDALVGAYGSLDLALEEVLRDLNVNPGTVARLAVGVDRPAMPHRLERLDALDHDLAARLAVDGDDAPHPASIVLVGRVVEAVLLQMARVSLPARDKLSPVLMLAHVRPLRRPGPGSRALPRPRRDRRGCRRRRHGRRARPRPRERRRGRCRRRQTPRAGWSSSCPSRCRWCPIG